MIEKVLENKQLTAYDQNWFNDKCALVYKHAYAKYQGGRAEL